MSWPRRSTGSRQQSIRASQAWPRHRPSWRALSSKRRFRDGARDAPTADRLACAGRRLSHRLCRQAREVEVKAAEQRDEQALSNG